MQAPILIINGPNLNLLGKREVEIYGNKSFQSFYEDLLIEYPNMDLRYFQTNHEGVIIDLLHQHGFTAKGILLNAGGYTHTSIAIRDAITAIESPVIEIHISDISKREEFRKHSYLTDVCVKNIMGKGLDGYRVGIEYFKSDH